MPFTIPIAAARFLSIRQRDSEFKAEQWTSYAGGRGIALDTHVRVIAKPNNTRLLVVCMNSSMNRLAGISGSHEEHRNVSARNLHSRKSNDKADYDSPPPPSYVEKSFASFICMPRAYTTDDTRKHPRRPRNVSKYLGNERFTALVRSQQ